MNENNLTHELVHVSEWTPDVRSEVPDCPTPVIERYVVRALIEACERARIWRWNLPEIPIEIGKTLYELETPTAKSCIHSVLNVEIDSRLIRDNTEESGSRGQERYYSTQNGVQSYHIPDRGFLELTRPPIRASQRIRSLNPPIVPPRPVDPGVVSAGFPKGITPYTDYARATRNLLSEFPDEQLTIVNWDEVGYPSGNVTIESNSLVRHSRFFDTGAGNYPSFLRGTDIDAARADGRPFMLLLYNSRTTAYPMSGFAASIEDLPLYLDIPEVEVSGSFTDRIFTDTIELIPNSLTSTIDGISNAGNSDDDKDETFEAMSSVEEFCYFKLNLANQFTISNTDTNVQLIVRDSFEVPLEYEIDIRNNPNEFLNMRAGENLMLMIRQPTETEIGKISYRSSNPIRDFDLAHPDVIEESGRNTVTQEQVDEFNSLLEQHNNAVVELAEWNALGDRTDTGMTICASIKPERDALEVPKVLFKDYYDLILNGALYRLMQMQNQKWTDKQQADRYRKEFEIDLNRARQQVDRGFNTKSQRIQPRRYI